MAKPVRHGSGWRARWVDQHGARQSATFDSCEDAEIYLRKMETEVAEIRHGWRTGKPLDRTVDELCDLFLATQLATKRSPKDITSIIEAHLRPFFGHMQVRRVTPAEIDSYAADRLKRLASKTVRNHLSLLQSLFGYAVECGWIERAPRVRKPKVQRDRYRYLKSPTEIARLLRVARLEGEDVFMLFATAIYTGMRAGELAGLRWADVDLLDRRMITVSRSFDRPTKTGETRYVPVYDVLHADLASWRLTAGQRHPTLVFPNRAGRMLTRSSRVFQETLHRVLDAAGFHDVEPVNGRRKRYVTFHDLRHTFASHYMMSGGNVFHLQRILGHRSLDMTNRYAHLAQDAIEPDRGRFGSGTARVAQPIARESGATCPRRAWST